MDAQIGFLDFSFVEKMNQGRIDQLDLTKYIPGVFRVGVDDDAYLAHLSREPLTQDFKIDFSFAHKTNKDSIDKLDNTTNLPGVDDDVHVIHQSKDLTF